MVLHVYGYQLNLVQLHQQVVLLYQILKQLHLVQLVVI